MSQKSLLQLEHSIDRLKSRWPKPLAKEAVRLFEQIGQSIVTLKKELGPSRNGTQPSFDFVPLVQRVLKVHDILFLNRRLSYHVVSTIDLPQAFGSEEEATVVLTELVATAVRHTGFGSRLEIKIQGAQLREGGAIQTKLAFEGKVFSDLDRRRLLEEIYGHAEGGMETSPMTFAKMVLRRSGGQFWLEFPKETTMALTLNWPAYPVFPKKEGTHFGTCKYDIRLLGFGRIRQRFGIPKANRLVTQVEGLIRSLVRHPMDIVIAFPSQGMVTTIYESQEGSTASVATRISQRLKNESFRIGKRNILPKFRYQLAFLT